MLIKIPRLSLVVLIGPSGSGKSTFARRHFLPTEVLSSDACRGMVGDDENDQAVTKEAFEVLRFVAGKRLALGRLTVVDATNVQPRPASRSSSWPGSTTAGRWRIVPRPCPSGVCQERTRDSARPGIRARTSGPQPGVRNCGGPLRGLRKEGFRHVFVLAYARAGGAATVERMPLWNDRREEHGPSTSSGIPRVLRRARGPCSCGWDTGGPAGGRRSALGWTDVCPPRGTQGGPILGRDLVDAAPASSIRSAGPQLGPGTARPSASPATTT
jgi:protein phosphatase